MRALTLQRPWVGAFCHYGKMVENRTWAPNLQQSEWIALHSGKSLDLHGARWIASQVGDDLLTVLSRDRVSMILALARFDRCYDGSTLEGQAVIEKDPWAFGPYVWSFDQVLVLKRPLAAAGKLGLWELPAETSRLLMSELVDAIKLL